MWNTIRKPVPQLGTELYNRSAYLPMRERKQAGVAVAPSFLALSNPFALARLGQIQTTVQGAPAVQYTLIATGR